jgi:hypothetical protein
VKPKRYCRNSVGTTKIKIAIFLADGRHIAAIEPAALRMVECRLNETTLGEQHNTSPWASLWLRLFEGIQLISFACHIVTTKSGPSPI